MADEENINVELGEEELEAKEIRQQFDEGRKLLDMVNSEGFADVLRPAFERRRKNLVKKFLNTKEYSDIVQIQQAINAIDNIFGFIDGIILLGKESMIKMKEKQVV